MVKRLAVVFGVPDFECQLYCIDIKEVIESSKFWLLHLSNGDENHSYLTELF